MKINQDALELLARQQWLEAQRLLFENARKNPSYQTHNNLGYFLITEGLTLKNGNARCAHKYGENYLLSAIKMRENPISYCALAVLTGYRLRRALITSKKKSAELYKLQYKYFTRAEKLCPSDREIRYNRLRAYCLVFGADESALRKAKRLLQEFECEETVLLYVEILRILSKKAPALACIEKYRNYFSEWNLLMFYATCGMYEEGYSHCDAFFHEFGAEPGPAAALMECCIRTGHFKEAEWYAREITEYLQEINDGIGSEWKNAVFRNLKKSTACRRTLLQNYREFPSMLTPCCYFGCTEHGTPWEFSPKKK